MRAYAIGMAFVLSVLGILAVTAYSQQKGADATLDARQLDDGLFVDVGVSAEQALALRSASPGQAAAPQVVHPPHGAVYPSTFPAVRLQWSDALPGRLYRVVVKSGESVLFEGVTRERELTPSAAAWDAMKTKAAGADLTVVVHGAVVGANGALIQVGRSTESHFRLATYEERPTGMMLFGQKHRPAGQEVGHVPLLMMHLRIDGYDLEQQQHRVIFRSSYGPQATQVHPERTEEMGGGPEGGGPEGGFHGPDGPGGDEITRTQCVSCHAVSHDGRYVAVFSQTAEEAPPEFDAPNGFLTVLTMPDRQMVIQLPHAFMPRFHPTDSSLLAFGEVDETIGTKDQMMVRKSDLHILDLKTGKHAPLPGAAEPDHVENFPFWSPDGGRIAFIRTRKNEMWHGSAGLIDIASVPYNEGKGGQAVLLKGASDNGRSNFLPVYSQDGRWIVFTQADQGFFSQESADLYIVPAEGGEARLLNCNSRLTESWHRFGPSGRWLAVVTNREDVRRPHIYLARFDTQSGTCKPAIQMPFVSGPGAHTHAFTWTARFDWLDDHELTGPVR